MIFQRRQSFDTEILGKMVLVRMANVFIISAGSVVEIKGHRAFKCGPSANSAAAPGYFQAYAD